MVGTSTFLYMNSIKAPVLHEGSGNNGSNDVWTSSVILSTHWTHVAISYSLSDGEIRQYINGEVDAVHKFNGNAKIRFDRRCAWAFKAT